MSVRLLQVLVRMTLASQAGSSQVKHVGINLKGGLLLDVLLDALPSRDADILGMVVVEPPWNPTLIHQKSTATA
jgi:hypothetical protein